MISNISEKIAPARKPHRCAECGRTIPKGEAYLHQVNSDGSQIWTYKAHVDCAEMSDQFRRENRLWGDDWLPLHEYFDDPRQVTAWRGLFPHAACRIALTQNLDL